MAKIITTIGPSSESSEVLKYFVDHNVEYARFNTSHNSTQWHIKTMLKARKFGLQILLDLAGPKVRLGNLSTPINLEDCAKVILEKESKTKKYPFFTKFSNANYLVLPIRHNIFDSIKNSDSVLIDDGKVELEVENSYENFCTCYVQQGGLVSSGKSINFPDSDINIDFLTSRDKGFLQAIIPIVHPEVISASFIQNPEQIDTLNRYIIKILQDNQLYDYEAKICSKIEQSSALKNQNLNKIVAKSDFVMVARGDLALETKPLHLMVPFYQETIKNVTHAKHKKLIIATQILESMVLSKTPTRAEISDLYRAIVSNQAEYVMLSAESATGKNPKEAVKVISDLLSHYKKLQIKANSLESSKFFLSFRH
ncbi:hypothetical protein HC864_02405 [Candidatus Gracilibacteria bacterium]|nr:hypothetical protein [Candidatus Gracilibacteria bacterium]